MRVVDLKHIINNKGPNVYTHSVIMSIYMIGKNLLNGYPKTGEKFLEQQFSKKCLIDLICQFLSTPQIVQYSILVRHMHILHATIQIRHLSDL